MMKALAEMLSNQSARDQSLASSLGQLRQEQVKEVDHDAPLLHRCIEEIEKLKVQLNEQQSDKRQQQQQPSSAQAWGLQASTSSRPQSAWGQQSRGGAKSDDTKLSSVRVDAEAVRQAMLVVKEQKKKLQVRMRELQTSREEWRADMEVYSNEPSGLHRRFLHG